MKGWKVSFLFLLTVTSCLSSPRAQRDVDEWLLAINGGAAGQDEVAVEREFREEEQYRPQPRPQEYKRQEQQYRPKESAQQFQPQSREQGFQPQQLPEPVIQLQPQLQEVPVKPYRPEARPNYPPQQPVQEYKPPNALTAQQRSQPERQYPGRPQLKPRRQQAQQYPGQANRPRYPPRRPLRRRPAQPSGGILNNIVKGAVDTVGSAVDAFSCGTQNLFAEASLQDEAFITKQFECVRGVGCCDNIGKRIKFLAPEVLQKRCPGCKPCEEKQINRVMSIVANKYSAEWSLLMTEFRKPGGGSVRNTPVKSCQ